MDDILDLLKTLITYRTTASRPDEIERCAGFIREWLEGAGVPCRRLTNNGVPSIAVMPEQEPAPVLLMAHFDVVEGEDAQFAPKEWKGRLYGRGSVDDKYAVAVAMVLARTWILRLQEEGLGPDRMPFGILLTGDEESGGYNGALPTLKHLRTDFAIALDGGAPDQAVTQEKGILRLKLGARGKPAHGARPWLGVNAIDILADDIVALRRHFTEAAEDHWHRTLNVGTIQGGNAPNQVPAQAEAVLDIRYTEADDIEELVKAVRETVVSEVTVLAREPLFDGGKSAYLDLFLALNPGIETCREHGASDARFLRERGIPGLVWGARGNRSQHSSEEHVEMESVGRVAGILDRFLRTIHDNRSAGRDPAALPGSGALSRNRRPLP